MRLFSFFTKLPESRRDEGNLKNFKKTSEINLIIARGHIAITSESHKELLKKIRSMPRQNDNQFNTLSFG